MTTYCEAYRGWHIWFDPEGGYVVGENKATPDICEGYFETRDEAKRDIDWHVNREPAETPPDTPSLGQPWWEHR